MSVIFSAKGCIVYPTQEVLEKQVTRLQRAKFMNKNEVWLNGARKPFNPDKKQVHRDWNGLILPRALSYRNLSTKPLLEDAEWARLIVLPGPSEETVLYSEDGEISRIHMQEWFRENVVDQDPHLGWTAEYIDEVWDLINTEPPAELKERMRVKNAARKTKALKNQLNIE